MSSLSSLEEMKLKLTLKDPRAIEIVKSIPIKQRDEVIEKYIILGEMVFSHAAIATRKETLEEFFAPLRSDIDMIREQLRFVIPAVTTPAKKGEITVETIFNGLKEHFMDDSFEDVSKIGKYSDILATTSDTKTSILIELKDYSGTVPSEEVEKFWRDIERRGTRYGIFISMRTGITKCSGCINIRTEMNKTALFVVNNELNWFGHIFAYHVIKKIIEIESMRKKELKGEELGKIISKVNNHVLELQKTVESIEKIQNIADSLKTTCNNKLGDLINLSNSYRRSIEEKITEIFEEIRKAEIS